MVDTVNEASVWPVNADGEIVVQAGTGDEYIYANFSFPLNLDETPLAP